MLTVSNIIYLNIWATSRITTTTNGFQTEFTPFDRLRRSCLMGMVQPPFDSVIACFVCIGKHSESATAPQMGSCSMMHYLPGTRDLYRSGITVQFSFGHVDLRLEKGDVLLLFTTNSERIRPCECSVSKVTPCKKNAESYNEETFVEALRFAHATAARCTSPAGDSKGEEAGACW